MTDTSELRKKARALAEKFSSSLGPELVALLDDSWQKDPQPPDMQFIPPQLHEAEPAIRSAIADTFAIEELGIASTSEEAKAILAHSDTVMIGGKRRLRLTDEARSDLLRRVSHTPLYQDVLKAANESDQRDFEAITTDEIRRPTAWLRAFLLNSFGRLEIAPAHELRSAVAALERLRLVDLAPGVPPLAEARRLVELAEFLEPMRMLVGATGGWDGTPAHDRFVGRTGEIRALRAFVDELASQGAGEAISRGAKRLGASIQGWATGRAQGVLVLEARGGLGKSALIAKFVLDHALSQTHRFPVAYLDFDRAALQPREPRQLLSEVARQVALQFPEVAQEIRALRQRLRDRLGAVSDSEKDLEFEPFAEFRSIVSRQLTQGTRTFLLVLDTMEVVQYDRGALEGVVALVNSLHAPDFRELRVVAAGRADIPELRQEQEWRLEGDHRKLVSLSIDEAKDMAERLGTVFLQDQWQTSWGARIAGAADDSDARREPLAVRVAVELLRSAAADEREKLSREIESLHADGVHGFIGPLYQRRVLDHVRDPEVKKLAWPGLILRRVTPEIVREVLAEHCGLNPTRLDETFEALSREVWIVVRDGAALRHQPDLRARTLPLMRRHNLALFEKVNRSAITYFARRQHDDLSHRAEWIYHRLLAGEDPDSIDPAWDPQLAPLLAGASEDFDRNGLAANYLLARTAARLQPLKQVLRMSPRLALEHVAHTSPGLGAMNDQRIEPLLVQLPLDAVAQIALSEAGAAAMVALAVKTGRWHLESAIARWREPHSNPDANHWHARADFAYRFHRARTSYFHSLDATGDEPGSRGERSNSYDPAVCRALTQDLALGRLRGARWADELDDRLAGLLESRSWRAEAEDLPTLRTIMSFGTRAVRPAVRAWLSLRRENSSNLPSAFSMSEILVLAPAMGMDQFDAAFKAADLSLKEVLSRGTPTRIADPGVALLLERELRNSLEDSSKSVPLSTLRRFAAARDEDWIVPISYAVARSYGGSVPDGVADRLASHEPKELGFIARTVKGRSRSPSDPVEIMRRADEASDLVGVARLFCDSATEEPAAQDLRELLHAHSAWRKAMEAFVARNESA